MDDEFHIKINSGHKIHAATYIWDKEVDKMNDEKRKQQILHVLAKRIRELLEAEELDYDKLQEVRLRVGQPLFILWNGKERFLPYGTGTMHIVTKEEIRETLEYMSHYSLYAYENELRQGFLTIEGGHRVGVAGKVLLENNKVKNMQYISSVNLRMSHEVLGCANTVLPYIIQGKGILHTLIISPPCCGKTTLLRDLIRQISDGTEYFKGRTVGVVDERSELGGSYQGIAQNTLGKRTDLLDCCPKAEGMLMLIRSMSPEVIVIDEIGGEEDVHALEYAMQCGCKMLASVHGLSMEDIREKPVLGELVKKKRFDRYVVLGKEIHPGEVKAIYDERGNLLCRNSLDVF